MSRMDDSLKDARILSQAQRGIELLASETDTDITVVREVYLCEYKRLAAAAHIKSYLPLVTNNTVRGILEQAHAGKIRVPRSR